MTILEVKNLNVTIGAANILRDINFEVNTGDILAIIGPNGAGKTMLLKTLMGLMDYQGNITWDKNTKIGYVPQRMEIETDVPLTVKEFFNLRSPRPTQREIKEALREVQLDESMLRRGLGEISVGQRQRILVAWAVLGHPSVLLFDEPTADIDIAGQESIYKMLHRLHHDLNLTIILISHDLNVVYKYAHKVLCLNKTKICYGIPSEALNTETLLKLYGGEKAFYTHHHEHN